MTTSVCDTPEACRRAIHQGVENARPTGSGYDAVTTIITYPLYRIRYFANKYAALNILGSRAIVVPGDTLECISFPTPHHESTQSFKLQ